MSLKIKQICPKCGKEFEILISENQLKNGKYRKHCSLSCANGHKQSKETKEKIRNSINKTISINNFNSLDKNEFEILQQKLLNYCKYPNKGGYKAVIKRIKNFKRKFNILDNNKYNCCWLCGKENCNSDFCKNLTLENISNLIKYFGLNPNLLGTEKILEEIQNIKEKLYNLYFIEGKSSSYLNKMFNYPSSIIQNIFPFLGLKNRNISESLYSFRKNSVIQITTSNKNFKHGWHKTWDNKNIYYRSSHELDFAKFLDQNHILYEVEKYRFEFYYPKDNKFHIYIPDFYLPKTNEFVEVKSTWTLDKEKLKYQYKAIKENGYNFTLILDKEKIKDIEIYLES